MISEICPRAYKNYLGLPILGSFLDEFTKCSQQHGYAHSTILNQLKHTRHIVAFLKAEGLGSPRELKHSDFENLWQKLHHDYPEIAGTVRQLERFFDNIHWLPPPSSIPKTRSDKELESFVSYLKDVRGLVNTTIQSHLTYLRPFLDLIGFETKKQALSDLNLKQIENFIAVCSRNLNRGSLQHVVGYLRAFLRFEYSKGSLHSPLHEMIDTPRLYRLEKLPRSLPWNIVNELLRSIERTDAQGIRNYAMLLLIATYGLRSCEVVSLTLDDIDWRNCTIRISQGKTDSQLILPLTNWAAGALIDYLKNGRPDLNYREIFLRVRAPHGRLKPTAVTEVFQRQVRISSLDIPYNGPHCLRHSYAVHLLRQGTSIKIIGDVLGHRNAESTCVYLRLAIDDLRSVALEVPKYSDINITLDNIAIKDLPPTRPGRKSNLLPLQSFLAKEIIEYLQLHRSLGKKYENEKNILHYLDSFLAIHYPNVQKLDGIIFNKWCNTFADLESTVKRNRMRVVRNFCLYRQRFHPKSFVPDILTFPANNSQFIPYILSPTDIARLICAARQLPSFPQSPLRPQIISLAIILFYTSGLRRNELLRLSLGDFNSKEATLLIRSTKFHKQRVIPLSASADKELRSYLKIRQQYGLPMNESSPIIWNKHEGIDGRAYSGIGLGYNWRILCTSLKIFTPKGIPPHIHNIRHSFAVNALVRWYQNGEDVMTKLPQLSTYMGHVSIVSTQHYLSFVDPLRSLASARFEHKYSSLILDRNKDN